MPQIQNNAQSQGWFDPQSGTSLANTGNLLDALGIPTTRTQNATIADIAIALSRGDKPIVALDSNEI